MLFPVKGIENDELWKIIRRFDKQMYHVKATTDGRKRGLWPELEMDLVNSEDEEFSPDRLRSNLERVYINFVSSACDVLPAVRLNLLARASELLDSSSIYSACDRGMSSTEQLPGVP
jgi:hypothetical protein